MWATDCKEMSVDAETVGGRLVCCLVSSDGASPGTTFWVGCEAEVWWERGERDDVMFLP